MLDINKGLTYEEYIESATDEELEVINKLEKQGKLNEKGIEEVLCVNKVLNIVVFSMTRCKDAATVIPFLMKLSDLNNNINIKFYHKEGNEELLESLTGEKRIPTIIALSEDGQVLRKFLEFPKFVNNLINENIQEKESIVNEFREGKYNKYIQQDLINLICGK